ncbi:MAG: valine--tRNA ligase [Armatimonadetes bacterium]|nr:valine--tRNA ligase [Armatimonadota bacterium]
MSEQEERAETLAKAYSPREVEDRWYAFWLEKNYFRADVEEGRPEYCITIPPPNVTGSLHLGHALCYTLQDILTRWKRMQGFNTLCLPGTDHAGIATHNVVEKLLAKEGLTRYDLGREKFVERVWQWKEASGNTILQQFRRMGYSFDWSRERFTLDAGYVDAVLETFVRWYEAGFIYEGVRVINWCPRCQTVISDIEVEFNDHQGHLYYLRYPLAGGDGFVVVATTRPETMLGDTAVAVHPEDERYAGVVGKTVMLPLMNRPIPVIGDPLAADPRFGTGAVKITPAHDVNDFETGLRNNLPSFTVIGPEGAMTEEAGKYAGLDRYEARKRVLEDLKARNLLEQVEDYTINLGSCERCHTVIEPLLSKQWFVRMNDIARPAIEVVKEGKIRFVPERYARIYLDWMENIRDWPISRQIWWGHRLPVYHCEDCEDITVAKTRPEKCAHCGSRRLRQDEDVLDTWFSSALWPFATLGWPEETKEPGYFYPTDVLVTAREILYLWVARMIMAGLYFRQEIPFRDVYIYATVLNKEGRRMSKSLGTGVDPIGLIEQYGADATRFGLIVQAAKGQDMRFSDERIEMSRNFCNKIWNAARFVLMNLADADPEAITAAPPESLPLELSDRWILSRLERAVGIVNASLEDYSFDEAARAIYEFIWNEYCDWYIELAKPRLNGPSRQTAQALLSQVMETALRLLHPFAPFITEEIWQKFPHRGESVMVAPFPAAEGRRWDEAAEKAMTLIQETTVTIRNLRAERKLSPGAGVEIALEPDHLAALGETGQRYVSALARAALSSTDGLNAKRLNTALTGAVNDYRVYCPASEEDIKREIDRLTAEMTSIEKDMARASGKLSNEQFVSRAPAGVVERERAIHAGLSVRLEQVRARIGTLKEASA